MINDVEQDFPADVALSLYADEVASFQHINLSGEATPFKWLSVQSIPRPNNEMCPTA